MAPSVNSPLQPIVIPEIVVPPHFTCLGSCLLQNGHPRESPSSLGALLLPSLAAPRGIPNSAKPKGWWRAQCLHYGIDMPASATIERMRARLEEGLRAYGGLVVPGELLDLEHKKCGEFRKLNAQVRDKVAGPGADSGSGKAKAKPKGKPKNEPPHVVTTTTITTTTTTKRANTHAASRGGSGAGAAKAAKASGARNTPVKNSGVSKPKPVVKKEAKKEGKKEDKNGAYNYPRPCREEILRRQREFLNTTNYTSPQGPRPTYYRPSSTWQSQATPTAETAQSNPTKNYARYSGPPRGGGSSGSSSGRPKWIPQGDSTFKQFGAPRGGRYGAGRSVSSSHQDQLQPSQHCLHAGENASPPAYGSWTKDVNDDMGVTDSDYSDGADGTAVRYEDLDILCPGRDGRQASTAWGAQSETTSNLLGDAGKYAIDSRQAGGCHAAGIRISSNTPSGRNMKDQYYEGYNLDKEEEDYDDDIEMGGILDDIIQDTDVQEHQDEEPAERELEKVLQDIEYEDETCMDTEVGRNFNNGPWNDHDDSDAESEQRYHSLESYHSEPSEDHNDHEGEYSSDSDGSAISDWVTTAYVPMLEWGC